MHLNDQAKITGDVVFIRLCVKQLYSLNTLRDVS